MIKNNTNRLRLTLYLAALACLSPHPAHSNESSEIKTFNTLNLNPLVQIFGLPSLDNTVQAKQGAVGVSLEHQVANYFTRSVLTDEAIKMDGETGRTDLTMAYGVTDNSTISLSLPYIRHSGGHLDNLIYEWHELFDMPQGGREKSDNDNIDIRYFRNNDLVVSRLSPTDGIGDIRLKYAHQLPVAGRELILQGEIKFPTGSIDRLTGSEGTDFSVGFVLNDTLTLRDYELAFWYGGATSYLEDVKGDLSSDQNNLAISGRAGIGWKASQTITLKTQLDTHTEMYDSDTDELGKAPFMITFGGDFSFSKRYRLELSAVEDLVTAASPDIIFIAKFSADFF